MTWQPLKQKLTKMSQRELLSLIGDLYKLNSENQHFLTVRFASSEQTIDLTSFKRIISENVCPKLEKPLRLSVARKAISDFKKATCDEKSIIELMIYYVEQGVQFTLMYGDIYETFYSSLESMFDSTIKWLKKYPDLQVIFLPRLEKIVEDAGDTGWGFYDYLSYAFTQAFPKKLTHDQ